MRFRSEKRVKVAGDFALGKLARAGPVRPDPGKDGKRSRLIESEPHKMGEDQGGRIANEQTVK